MYIETRVDAIMSSVHVKSAAREEILTPKLYNNHFDNKIFQAQFVFIAGWMICEEAHVCEWWGIIIR